MGTGAYDEGSQENLDELQYRPAYSILNFVH